MAYDLSMRVWRGDASGGALADYRVPVEEGEVVLDAIHRIQQTQSGDLAVRWNCKAGKCGSCSAEVNGRPRLMCMTRLSDFDEKETITITPMRAFPVIRDLVTDMDSFMEKLGSVKPWIVREHSAIGLGEFIQTNEQIDQYRQFSMCINCMLCYSACPVIAIEPDFIGPAAIALARRYELDSRDHAGEERLKTITASDGIWDCSYVGECSAVCPKGVDPARAIQQTKFDSTMGVLLPWGGK